MLGAAASWTLPVFLEKTFFALDALAADSATQAVTGKDGTILVVLQMAGGNDGLNTVIPYADDAYHVARPRLRLAADHVLKIDNHIALNPRLVDLPSFSASAALEAEVGGLGPDEAKELLGAYGIEEPVLGRVIDSVYRLLDLITFFTAGDTESRAWEVRRGATAPEAAGVIPSDIQRGFIRAEIIGYEALVAAGSWNNAKAKGVLRLEGKDYQMVEGDVCHFRFAV